MKPSDEPKDPVQAPVHRQLATVFLSWLLSDPEAYLLLSVLLFTWDPSDLLMVKTESM